MIDYDPIPGDTTPEAAREQYARLREMSPQERARMTFELNDMMRSLAEQGIRKRHPEYDEESVRRALIRLTAGEELFRRLVGKTADQPDEG